MAGTGIAYPADAVSGSPAYAAINGRNAFSAAMAGATASRPLGGISGVRPGTPSTTITATSTTWTMNPNGFAGYIDLETSATNSGYFFAFSGTITGSVTAAGGSARTDLVYVQINDSNTSDGSSGSPRVVIDYISNYPTTALPARAFAIAQINVPASGGGAPTVTWIAPYSAAAGGIQPVPGSSFYPSGPYDGQFWYDNVTHQLKFYNGTTNVTGLEDTGWVNVTFTNSWANVSGFTTSYRRLNGTVYIRGRIQSGTANTPAFTLPAGFRPAIQSRFPQVDGSAATAVTVLVDSTGAVTASGTTPNLGLSFIAEA